MLCSPTHKQNDSPNLIWMIQSYYAARVHGRRKKKGARQLWDGSAQRGADVFLRNVVIYAACVNMCVCVCRQPSGWKRSICGCVPCLELQLKFQLQLTCNNNPALFKVENGTTVTRAPGRVSWRPPLIINSIVFRVTTVAKHLNGLCLMKLRAVGRTRIQKWILSRLLKKTNPASSLRIWKIHKDANGAGHVSWLTDHLSTTHKKKTNWGCSAQLQKNCGWNAHKITDWSLSLPGGGSVQHTDAVPEE